MKPKKGAATAAKAHGELRQSQVVSSFGPGAMVDLPNHAALISGLEFWSKPDREIFEERLASKVASALELQAIRMYAPPVDPPGSDGISTGITAWLFPGWFVAQKEERHGEYRSRRLIHYSGLEKGKFIDRDRKKYKVIPVRFVQACVNGHISDISWYDYVHSYTGSCRRELWFDERGTTGEIADIIVRCDCGIQRPLVQASQITNNALGFCKGKRPWLGNYSDEKCGREDEPAQPNRLLIRSASNSYFPQVLSAISIPDVAEKLRKAVDAIWDDLEVVDELGDLQHELKKTKIKNALEGLAPEDVLGEIKRRKGSGGFQPTKTVKQAEIETLLASEEEVGSDQPEGMYFARRAKLKEPRSPLMHKIDRVVLVHRLREVRAQIGFTRFEPVVLDLEGELNLDVRRATLSRDISWVPAIENRGEGVFLSIDREYLRKWRERDAVRERGNGLLRGFESWQSRHSDHTYFAGLDYVFLHSLSHLLITAVSLECGYGASSIRERIYASPSGFGILLYTGTPDSEGTLGGLVQAASNFEHFLRSAANAGTLCSNDPVCAQHDPSSNQEERFLSGAACHGCLLIAEPSCERRNEFLDRALVVPTVAELGAEFFTQEDL